MVKRFLLDTNILLNNPRSMTEGFDDNIVIICGTTLQELDKKKTVGGEIGYKARECCRLLDNLRMQGDIIKGIPLPNKGMLMVEPDGVKQEYLPEGFSIQVPDNRIISTCIHLTKQNEERPVILVTNDISMRINATACGVKVEGYRNDQVEESGYTGHTVKEINGDLIDKIHKEGMLNISDTEVSDLYENEFVTLKDKDNPSHSALSVHRSGTLILIKDQTSYNGITAKNSMQNYALWALSAPADMIPLVVLNGPAGTAKTFLSLAAGLDTTYVNQRKGDDGYERIIISRPSAGGFNEMGYLPGDMKQKLDPLLAPYYDNLKILIAGTGKYKESPEQVRIHMTDMFESGLIEILALSFVRGRSLMDTYLICDEAQNASKSLIRDVVTRAGKGTKVVICGDPNQIDQPTLDRRNNGLVYVAESMKNSPLCAICTFSAENSVRSELSKDAVKRMK